MATHAAPSTPTRTRRRWRDILFPHTGRRFAGAPLAEPVGPLPEPKGKHHRAPADPAATMPLDLPRGLPYAGARPYRDALVYVPYGESPLVRAAYDSLAASADLPGEER